MEYPLLLEFLDSRLEAALHRERFNQHVVYLYSCGDSWLAWEHSACLLEERFHYKSKEPLIFHLKDGNRVVMVEVPTSLVGRILSQCKTARKEEGYVRVEMDHPARNYVKWKECIWGD